MPSSVHSYKKVISQNAPAQLSKPWLLLNLKRLIRKNSVYLPNGAKHLTQSINILTISFEIRFNVQSKEKQYKLRILDKLHVSSSSSDFRKTVKDLIGTTPQFNATLKTGNDMYYVNVSKANLFNKYFASISSVTDVVLSKPFLPFNYITNLRIPPLTIEPFAVCHVSAGLNSRKSKGFDNLPNQLLKSCSMSLATPFRLF